MRMRARSFVRVPRMAIVLVLALMSLGSGDRPARAAAPSAPFNMTHWWPADGTPTDIVGGDDGSLLDGVVYGPGVNGDDQAFGFDGTGGEVRFNDRGGNFGRRDFTIAFFIQTSSSRQEAVWEKRLVCDANSFWGFRIDDGLLGWEMMSDQLAHGYNSFIATTSVADGAWHHVALVRAGRTASLYIDGVADASRTIDTVTDIWNDAPARAGMSACVGIDGTQPFTGQLDEQMMFTRALTQEQIQAVIDHVTG